MAEAAGFHFKQLGGTTRRLAPVILLHGSGGSEDSLINFWRTVTPKRAAFAMRGQVPWEGGYAFFRRNPDRTLDQDDLAVRCAEFCGFLSHLIALGYPKPLLIGFSNGAILAAAAVIRDAALSSGAILLRPLSPCADKCLRPLDSYPVLLVGAATDARRHPSDTPHLANQFQRAGAQVTMRVLPTGHDLDAAGGDHSLAREWLADRA